LFATKFRAQDIGTAASAFECGDTSAPRRPSDDNSKISGTPAVG